MIIDIIVNYTVQFYCCLDKFVAKLRRNILTVFRNILTPDELD